MVGIDQRVPRHAGKFPRDKWHSVRAFKLWPQGEDLTVCGRATIKETTKKGEHDPGESYRPE